MWRRAPPGPIDAGVEPPYVACASSFHHDVATTTGARHDAHSASNAAHAVYKANNMHWYNAEGILALTTYCSDGATSFLGRRCIHASRCVVCRVCHCITDASLSALAIALTVYGVYVCIRVTYFSWDYFAAFRVWPKELREPLRAALKARLRGKWERSAKNFRMYV